MSLVINKDRAKKIAFDYIYDKLGSNMEPGEPTLGDATVDDKQVQIWIVPVNADYPRIFEDVRNNGVHNIVMQLGAVGELEIDAETGEPITTPHRHSVESAVLTELEKIRDSVEKMLVRTASAKLAKLVSLRHMLTPVQTLLTNLMSKQQLHLSYLEASGVKPNYLILLKRSNFIDIDDKEMTIRPTKVLNGLYEQFWQKGEESEAITRTLEVAVEEILLNDYNFIYNELKLRTLAPYVHIASSYYNNALAVNDLVEIHEDALAETWQRIYGINNIRKQFKFPEYLRQLSIPNIGIMEPAGNNAWRGNEDIFKEMSKDNPLKKVIPA